MAGVSFEEFSAPPGSDLALEPLFGGNILESEGEPEAGPEAGPEPAGGGAAPPLPPRPRPLPRQKGGEGRGEGRGEGEGEEPPEERRRRLKVQALARRCRHVRQVNARALQRLRQVQRVTRRLQLERRFLMQVLDSHGDRYRQGQLTVLLQDEGGPCGGLPAAPTPGNAENEPPERGPAPPPAPPPPPEPPGAKRRRRDPRGGGGARRGAPQNPPGGGPQPKGEEPTLGPAPTWGPPSPPEKPPRVPKFSSPDFD